MTHNHVPGIGKVCPMQTFVRKEVINSSSHQHARPISGRQGQGHHRNTSVSILNHFK